MLSVKELAFFPALSQDFLESKLFDWAANPAHLTQNLWQEIADPLCSITEQGKPFGCAPLTRHFRRQWPSW